MALSDPTFIGQVASVTGALVRVRLRDDMPSTLIMIKGISYRVGQIGGFFRVPLGYTNLYAVCTQIGADAAPRIADGDPSNPLEDDFQNRLAGFRWMSIVLFGEGVADEFERGVGQYPTVGDEVHIVTNDDLEVIYGWAKGTQGTISVGQIAAGSGISADLSVPGLVSRHCAVVGATGSGKSNLVTVLLETVSDGSFPNSRTIVIDPHGEYASALGDDAQVFRVKPDLDAGDKPLIVPFWALPFSELQQLTMGGLQPNHEATIRDIILDMKKDGASKLITPPALESLTADSPVPFCIKKLWYELDRFERMTFKKSGNQGDADLCDIEEQGDPETLTPDRFPAASPYNQLPLSLIHISEPTRPY